MRTYARVATALWQGELAEHIHGRHFLQALVVYLISSAHNNMSGFCRLPLTYVVADLGCTRDEAEAGLEALESWGFLQWDRRRHLVWIVEMARHELPELLKVRDKRVKWLRDHLQGLRKSPLYRAFLERYAEAFAVGDLLQEVSTIRDSDGHSSPSEKAPRSQPQQQTKPQEQEPPQKPGQVPEQDQEPTSNPSPSERAGAEFDPAKPLSSFEQVMATFEELGLEPPEDGKGRSCIPTMLHHGGKNPKVVVEALRELGRDGCLKGLEYIYGAIRRQAREAQKARRRGKKEELPLGMDSKRMRRLEELTRRSLEEAERELEEWRRKQEFEESPEAPTGEPNGEVRS